MMIAFDDGSLIEQINEGIRKDVDINMHFWNCVHQIIQMRSMI